MKYKEELIEAIEEDDSLMDTAHMLFMREDNYNNADVTSGQCCLTEHEIFDVLTSELNLLKEEDGHCFNCGRELTDTDYSSTSNSVPYGDTYVDEEICDGYTCRCGHEESF